jgi:hypothetical protein
MVTAAGAKVVDFGLAAAAGAGEREEVDRRCSRRRPPARRPVRIWCPYAGRNATPTGPHTKTLTSPGGSVVARCGLLGRATLLSWTPTPPYTVARINSGPAYLAYVVFATSTSRIRMNVTCKAGQPVAAVVYL